MDRIKFSSAIIKGLIGSGIAATAALLFHGFIVPTSDFTWSLLAVTLGSFFSGFFAEYTDKIVCEDKENDKKDQYITIGSVFFILGVTNVMENKITSVLFVLGGLLFGLAAYREGSHNLLN